MPEVSEPLGVPLEVLLEVLPQHKALSTHLAAVVSNARVHEVVPVQIALEVELAPADRAGEHFVLRRVAVATPASSASGQVGRRLEGSRRQFVVCSGQEEVEGGNVVVREALRAQHSVCHVCIPYKIHRG